MKKLIIIALFMSIITGFSVYYYANNVEKSFSVKTVPVAVAAIKIPPNTLIKPEMVILKQLPTDQVNSLAVRNPDEVRGRISRESIEANEQVLSTRLSNPDEKNDRLSYVIKQGYRALSIKTDEISGVAGYINKGDYIDIIAVMIDMSKPSGTASKMVAENIEVLEVGMKSTGPADSKGATSQYTSITVSVLAEDLLKINYALSEGKCNIALHSVLDKNVINPAPYSP